MNVELVYCRKPHVVILKPHDFQFFIALKIFKTAVNVMLHERTKLYCNCTTAYVKKKIV